MSRKLFSQFISNNEDYSIFKGVTVSLETFLVLEAAEQ
jgi:hypothetical protein